MKILILYSGGLDSLVMGYYARVNYPEAEYKEVFFDLGQPYANKEKHSLPPEVEQRVLDWPDLQIEGKEGPSGNIYIPGRNLLLAVTAACQYLPDRIWLGALAGETHDRATDKNYKFLELLNSTLQYVLSPFKKGIVVEFPLANAGFSKLDSVKWAMNHGVSKEKILKSSSCLSGEAGNCGHCLVCLRRWGIFKQLGLEEQYNVDVLEHPDNIAVIKNMLTSSYYDDHRKSEVLPALTEDYKERVLRM